MRKKSKKTVESTEVFCDFCKKSMGSYDRWCSVCRKNTCGQCSEFYDIWENEVDVDYMDRFCPSCWEKGADIRLRVEKENDEHSGKIERLWEEWQKAHL